MQKLHISTKDSYRNYGGNIKNSAAQLHFLGFFMYFSLCVFILAIGAYSYAVNVEITH